MYLSLCVSIPWGDKSCISENSDPLIFSTSGDISVCVCVGDVLGPHRTASSACWRGSGLACRERELGSSQQSERAGCPEGPQSQSHGAGSCPGRAVTSGLRILHAADPPTHLPRPSVSWSPHRTVRRAGRCQRPDGWGIWVLSLQIVQWGHLGGRAWTQVSGLQIQCLCSPRHCLLVATAVRSSWGHSQVILTPARGAPSWGCPPWAPPSQGAAGGPWVESPLCAKYWRWPCHFTLSPTLQGGCCCPTLQGRVRWGGRGESRA